MPSATGVNDEEANSSASLLTLTEPWACIQSARAPFFQDESITSRAWADWPALIPAAVTARVPTDCWSNVGPSWDDCSRYGSALEGASSTPGACCATPCCPGSRIRNHQAANSAAATSRPGTRRESRESWLVMSQYIGASAGEL